MTIHSIAINEEEKEIYQTFENLSGADTDGNSLDFTNYYMQYNKNPLYIIMGEFHYSRYPHTEWENEVIKIKMSGVNTIATYIFWNMHERKKGVFDYSGDLDLRRFVQICKKHGLYVVLRIGPFAHGEVRNGGIPDWLYGRPFKLRSNDQRYLDLVKRLYDSIAAEVTGLYFEDGGPIVGIQLENEFMHCGAPWEMTYKQQLSYVDSGEGGYDHMMALKRTAVECGMNPVFFSLRVSWRDQSGDRQHIL